MDRVQTLTIVTAADYTHAVSAARLAGMITELHPEAALDVWDLGMTAADRAAIQAAHPAAVLRNYPYASRPPWHNIRVNCGGFWAWKPCCIADSAEERAGIIVWADAGCVLSGRLDWELGVAAQHGVYSGSTSVKIGDYTHPATLDRMHVPVLLRSMRMRAATLVAVDLAGPHADLLEEWRIWAMDRACIAPDGATVNPAIPTDTRPGHRHRGDQSVFGAMMARRDLAETVPDERRAWAGNQDIDHRGQNYERGQVMTAWAAYRSRVHCQHGEDGIIAEMMRRLGITKGQFFEAGAWDGIHLSNTRALLEAGWEAVYIEPDKGRCVELRRNVEPYAARVCVIEAWIRATGKDSLDALLAGTPLRPDFDLFSLDIDGPDYQCWESMERYMPLVVVIEIDPRAPAHARYIHNDRSVPLHTGGWHQTGFGPMVELGKRKGYRLVCHEKGNLIFIRADHAERLGDVPEDPYAVFDPYLSPPVSVMTERELFARYKGECRAFIETGTWKGEGVQAALDAGFESIISFEVNPATYTAAVAQFAGEKRVTILNASSDGKQFADLVASLKEPALFWLDGHPMTGAKCETVPLKAEINRLMHAPCRAHRILIDDVRLFETRFGLSVEGVMTALSSVNSAYAFRLETKHPDFHRDVLVAIPEEQKCLCQS